MIMIIIIIIITIITIMVVVAYQHRLGKRTLLLNNRFTTCCTFGGLRWVIIAHTIFLSWEQRNIPSYIDLYNTCIDFVV